MKRIISVLFILALLVGVFPFCAGASERAGGVTYLEDGSYIVEEIEIFAMRASGSVAGNKKYTYYDSDDVSQWKVTLTGKFTYTGTSATCTSSSVDVTVYDSSWYASSKSANKSGNKATAYVKMCDKPSGLIIQAVPVSLTLTCDSNGNLS